VSLVRYELGFYIPEDILRSHRRKILKFYTSLTGWALYRRHVSPMRYELGVLYPRRRHSSQSPP
jgi:hypothetical protein